MLPDAAAQWGDSTVWPAVSNRWARQAQMLQLTEAMNERWIGTPGNAGEIVDDVVTSNTWWISRKHAQTVVSTLKTICTNWVDQANVSNTNLNTWVTTTWTNANANDGYWNFDGGYVWTQLVWDVTGTNHLTGCDTSDNVGWWIKAEMLDELRTIVNTMTWAFAWSHQITWANSTTKAAWATSSETYTNTCVGQTNLTISSVLSSNWTETGTCDRVVSVLASNELPHFFTAVSFAEDVTSNCNWSAEAIQATCRADPELQVVWSDVQYEADLYAGCAPGWNDWNGYTTNATTGYTASESFAFNRSDLIDRIDVGQKYHWTIYEADASCEVTGGLNELDGQFPEDSAAGLQARQWTADISTNNLPTGIVAKWASMTVTGSAAGVTSVWSGVTFGDPALAEPLSYDEPYYMTNSWSAGAAATWNDGWVGDCFAVLRYDATTNGFKYVP